MIAYIVASDRQTQLLYIYSKGSSKKMTRAVQQCAIHHFSSGKPFFHFRGSVCLHTQHIIIANRSMFEEIKDS